MLTERQKQVFEFIDNFTKSAGYPPTLREIGETMNIRSTNGVSEHIKALIKKGYLQRDDFKSRGLRSTEMSRPTEESADFVSIPLVGRVAAGHPILALENIEDTVKVDRFFIGNNRDVFALRVQGESMIEAGIFNGDFIFVKKQPVAKTGEIVVAMINDEATVKYYYPQKDSIEFKPANKNFEPIVVKKSDFKTVDLIGTVVGIYRKF